jgi:hypothetical protein
MNTLLILGVICGIIGAIFYILYSIERAKRPETPVFVPEEDSVENVTITSDFEEIKPEQK